MVIARNSGQSDQQFEMLLENTVKYLLKDVQSSEERREYYLTRSAQKLEDDVMDYMELSAEGTPFEGYIEKISGQQFPDIIANDFYGVEVKTTKSDRWRSTGNSVLESTRVENIEKIYMLFGKLSDPIGFRFKKYEDCLVDVAVTHAPRYLIDMDISKDETIFSRIDISYEDVRKHENPARPLLTHYREKMGEEASSWWLDIGEESIEEEPVSPLKITHWRLVSKELKEDIITKAFVYFPEILDSSSVKFTRLAVWLMKKHSIVNPSLRDPFTAGGTTHIVVNGRRVKVPQMMKTLYDNGKHIHEMIMSANPEELGNYWGLQVNDSEKFEKWLLQASTSGDSYAKKYDPTISIEEIVQACL